MPVDHGHDEWRAWEAKLDRQRALAYGPPPERVRTACHLAEQERALFGDVTRMSCADCAWTQKAP